MKLFSKTTESSKKLSWLYAVVTALPVVSLALILIYHQIIEIFDARMVYVFFILMGILGFSVHLAKRSEESISFADTFKKCLRTGAYMFVILVSVVLIVFMAIPDIDAMEQGGKVSEESSRIGFFISMGIEILATILISSFVAAFIPGIFHKRRKS